ncbi:AraC family transcriptional regulator [Clostridium cellulovorans]|uniref:Transcriptional regulator, AraC family n=1 Tax=Clostridium cellulovorans (strain ATCC 35296 / DSM 3052 / OCM 3 / 743B) TaxID=573061 RepID=D9SQS4_CLOC7|nr:AraC family transcriptional regulator [Clostridium cellulovorans]ADL52280.1 transcriptional regulator, AraC family [Clostridium cellulovorans 743B]
MWHCQYIIDTSAEASNLDLMLYYCGKETCIPNHTWMPNLKERFLIHYIFSGKGSFEINGYTYNLESGQGFLISPGDIATYKADDKDPWTYAWVEFNGRLSEKFLHQIGLSSKTPVFSCKKKDLLEASFQYIFDACKKSRNNNLLILSSLYHFLAMIHEASAPEQTEKNTEKLKDYYIHQAMIFIEKNYYRNLCISEMAKYLSLNRNYMSTLFKESVGITPQAYLINYRMDKAKELMKNSSLTIGEISSLVGYNDPLMFSRMFKKLFGIPPKNYRNSINVQKD